MLQLCNGRSTWSGEKDDAHGLKILEGNVCIIEQAKKDGGDGDGMFNGQMPCFNLGRGGWCGPELWKVPAWACPSTVERGYVGASLSACLLG